MWKIFWYLWIGVNVVSVILAIILFEMNQLKSSYMNVPKWLLMYVVCRSLTCLGYVILPRVRGVGRGFLYGALAILEMILLFWIAIGMIYLFYMVLTPVMETYGIFYLMVELGASDIIRFCYGLDQCQKMTEEYEERLLEDSQYPENV